MEQSKKASVAAVDPIKDEGKATAQDCQQLPSGTDRQTSSLTAREHGFRQPSLSQGWQQHEADRAASTLQ